MYNQIKNNSVDAKNQLMQNEYVTVFEGSGKKIMFLGNSITYHPPKDSIDWHHNWGMAASEKGKDYVHLVMNKVYEKDAHASYCIGQVSLWEREFKDGSKWHSCYKDAGDYEADIIIARFAENCPLNNFDEDIFKKEYAAFIDYLNKSGKAKIIYTTGFWRHPANHVIKAIAKENNAPCIILDDLGECDDMKALGLFSHTGVANHPGDKGMKEIAERIWAEVKKLM